MTGKISYKRKVFATMGLATALTVLGVAGWSLMAQAHEPPRKSLRAMTDEANLIFQGVVSKVEYGMAKGTDSEDAELPQTYVTFQMESVEKGKSSEGNKVTLRFLGGPAKDGRILVVSNAPLFDEGERVMAFVKGNGESDCPLVSCDKGRFRIINNQMYTNDGQEVRQTARGNIFFGKRRNLPEVINNKIGKMPFNFERDSEEAEGVEKGKGQYQQGEGLRIQGEHLNIQKFKGRVAKEKTRIRPEKLAALKPVRSLKPGQPFKALAQSPQGPRLKVAPERKSVGQQNEFDKAEALALKNQNFNPVFKEGPPRGLKPGLAVPGLKPGLSIPDRSKLQPKTIPGMERVFKRGIEPGMAGDEDVQILEGNMLFDDEDDLDSSGELQP